MELMPRIRRLMDERDINQVALANIAGVSKGTVSQWFNGRFEPKADSLARIASYFGVTVDYLMTGRDEPVRFRASPARMVPVRVLGAAHAGEPDEPWEIEGEAMLYEELALRHPNCYALEVNGSCMDRVFTEQDYIFVDPDAQPRDNSIAVMLVDGRCVARRVRRGNGSLLLVSESHDPESHEDIFVKDGDVRCLGCVFWWQARNALC